jgi:hypothetical protein
MTTVFFKGKCGILFGIYVVFGPASWHPRHPNESSAPIMFTVTFLGTSASVPSAERNHPGLLVEAG